MGTLMGGLAFAIFLLAQIAAVVAVHAERESSRSPFDAARLGRRTRQIWESGS